MKVGDRVILTGYTLAPKWRGKLALIVETSGHMLTVDVPPDGRILVFTKEVELYSKTLPEVENETV